MWSILESPSTSDYGDMDNGISKSTALEPTIKNLLKEKIIGSSVERNLVQRRQNIGAEIYLMGKGTLKEIIGCSRYNTITK